MKRMILSNFLFIGFVVCASAQSSGSTGSSTGSGASDSASKSSTNKKPSDSLNNRKIYHFNNGQRSTPTGAEATPSGTGGGYAALGKDTTATVITESTGNPVAKKSVAKGRKKTTKRHH